MRRGVYCSIVGGTGLILALPPIYHLAVHSAPLFATLIGNVVPIGGTLIVIASAGWLYRSPYETRLIGRITTWFLIGLFTLGAISSFQILHMNIAEGVVLPRNSILFTISNTAIAGSIAGLAIGIYDAKAKLHQNSLRQERDRLDQFASIVSHDLRNPLNVAEGRIVLAQEEHESEHHAAATQALDRMNQLIESILTLAREDAAVTSTDQVNLADTIAYCWENVETKNARLSVESTRDIEADQARLQQLLENLIRNAVDHGGEEVTVTIGDCDGGFFVEDNGPGIGRNDRRRVLEPGYSTSATGSGIGLSIVREIVDAHGWNIMIKNSEDGGARFEITGIE